jgi:hypothetical protein
MDKTAEEVAGSIANDVAFWAKTVDEDRRMADVFRRGKALLAEVEAMGAEAARMEAAGEPVPDASVAELNRLRAAALGVVLEKLRLTEEHNQTLHDAIEARTNECPSDEFFNRVSELLSPVANEMMRAIGVGLDGSADA